MRCCSFSLVCIFRGDSCYDHSADEEKMQVREKRGSWKWRGRRRGGKEGRREGGITTFLLQGDRRQHSVGEEGRVESNWVTFKTKNDQKRRTENKQMDTVTQQYLHNKRDRG